MRRIAQAAKITEVACTPVRLPAGYRLVATSECVIACTDRAMRFCTPTLRISLATCAFTVRSSIPNTEPISLFERPTTSISRTSFSRSVNATRPAGNLVMNIKAAGSRIEEFNEHVRTNPGSFSTTFSADQWEVAAGLWTLSPARIQAGQTQLRDQSAYSTVPTQQNWHDQIVGSHPSPAQVSANRVIRNGSYETVGGIS